MRCVVSASVAIIGVGALLVSVELARGVPPSFSNQSAAAGVASTHATSGFSNSQYAGGGAVGDFNKDGWQDFVWCSGGNGGNPDRLFINDGDGTFTNQAAAWGLTAVHRGKGVSVADYDGDGWLDIYMTSAGPPGGSGVAGQHKLYHNNGNGTFTNMAVAAGVNQTTTASEDGWGSTFMDHDLDGDLDLFVAGFASGNAGSKLFRNNGDATFTNVTGTSGTGGTNLFAGIPTISGFSPRFLDQDGDRYPDFYYVADFNSDRYFKNNGDGTFTHFTAGSGACQEENGMGQCVGDFNRDGKIDYYVTSIYNPGIGWTGNKLYKSNGNNTFIEYGLSAGVRDGGYGWGALGIDFNHDGWQDIAETNGDSSGGGMYFNEQCYLWMNNGTNTFTEMATTAGFIQLGKGRGMVSFDYDNDGDQDVIIFANNEPLYFLRNNLPAGPDTHWLRVFLDTTGVAGLAPNGIGAKITAMLGGVPLVRSIEAAPTFLSQPELSAHYGLGSAELVSQVTVEWPDGQLTTVTDIAANQTLTITPATIENPADLDGDIDADLADYADFGLCLTGPGGGILTGCGAADFDTDVDVDLADYSVFENSFAP